MLPFSRRHAAFAKRATRTTRWPPRGLEAPAYSGQTREVAGRPGLVYWMTAVASSTSNRRSRSSPARLMPPRRCTPGLERFVGILIGVAADCLLIIFWPLKGDKQQ